MFDLKRVKVAFTRAFSSQFGSIFSDPLSLFILGLLFLAFSFVAGWFPDGVTYALVEGEVLKGAVMVGASLVVLAVTLYLSSRFLLGGTLVAREKKPEEKEAVVFFLSKVRGGEESFSSLLGKLKGAGSVEEKLELLNEHDGGAFSSWRMPLEVVKFHLPRLRHFYLITSPESSDQLGLFKKLLEAVFPGASFEVLEERVGSMEDFNEVLGAVERVYGELKRLGYSSRDAVLDVTGGRKIPSIVGGLTSLPAGRVIEYLYSPDWKNYYLKFYEVELLREVDRD